MRDNDLLRAIVGILQAGLTAQGNQALIAQTFQPTQQGTPLKNTLYVFKIADRRIGSPEKKDEWVEGFPDYMRHTFTQQMETDFQISATAIQNPRDSTLLTASDLAELAAAILQFDTSIKAFKDLNIGVLRILAVRNPPFVDDMDRNEFNPSFDFTLTHEQVIISTSPVVRATEFNINRV